MFKQCKVCNIVFFFILSVNRKEKSVLALLTLKTFFIQLNEYTEINLTSQSLIDVLNDELIPI